MTDASSHLREINHRVKNNLQIIVSLMSLKKRTMPVERWEDIRFLQEHVQCMAVAYRLIYDTGETAEVSISVLTEALRLRVWPKSVPSYTGIHGVQVFESSEDACWVWTGPLRGT